METQLSTNYINDGYIINNGDEEDVIQIPYNINNTLASEKDIIDILAKNNVVLDKINHLHFFHQAFTHKSYCQKNIIPENVLEDAKKELGNPPDLLELRPASYERLEYFGDRVVKICVSLYLFYRYPKEDEGFMTRLQTKIEDKTNLAIMSKEIGLGRYFIISKQIESLNGRNLEKIHEDVFEAFMGALFLSNGFEPCLLLLLNLLETLIDYSDKLYRDNNYKDSLLRHHHKQKWKFPKYHLIHFEGPPHKRTYIMGVINPMHDGDIENVPKEDICISYGLGSSKKEGEQQAAKMSLIIHGLLKEDQYTTDDIYYPPWDKLAKYDGEKCVLVDTEESISDKESVKSVDSEKVSLADSDNESVYSDLSVETSSDIDI